MPVQPPSASELVRIAAQFGLDLEGAELEELTALAAGMIASYRRLDELDAPPRPVKYPRLDSGHRPLGEENPGNGWVWKCSIPGAARGPAVRRARRDQGQHLPGRHPDAQRHARCSRASSRARMRRSSPDCSTRARRSSARPPSRRSASTAARSPAIRRLSRRIRTTRRACPGRRRAAARSWSRSARPTWRSAATRAARSGCRPRGAASSATSPPGASCPTRARSRSS